MGQRDPYWLALQRAPHQGEHPQVRALRDYTHAEMLAGRIDGATQDRIGQLLDEMDASLKVRVGDVIGPRGPIPWDVAEVKSLVDGGRYTRLLGRDRHTKHQEYDWATMGGWATDEGLLDYAPLQVLRVFHHPGSVPEPALVNAITYALGPAGMLTVAQLLERVRVAVPLPDDEAWEQVLLNALDWMSREGRAYQPSPRRWAMRRTD